MKFQVLSSFKVYRGVKTGKGLFFFLFFLGLNFIFSPFLKEKMGEI